MPASPRTLEIIAENIRALLTEAPQSCLWLTFTFPLEMTNDQRKAAFRRWYNNFGRTVGRGTWVPQLHTAGKSAGKLHFHGVLQVLGCDFEAGFNHAARAAWVKTRSEWTKVLWMRSGSPDLRRFWKLRKSWAKYGLGHVDMVPFQPATIPQAVARYMAAYTNLGEHPKGTRLLRVTGYRRGQERPVVSNRKVVHNPHEWPGAPKEFGKAGKPCLTFSRVGERSSIFGKLKQRGDIGERKRGWARRAVLRGAASIPIGRLPHCPFVVRAVVRGCCDRSPGRRERRGYGRRDDLSEEALWVLKGRPDVLFAK